MTTTTSHSQGCVCGPPRETAARGTKRGAASRIIQAASPRDARRDSDSIDGRAPDGASGPPGRIMPLGRYAAAGGALLLMLTALAAMPAQAQTDTTLVSNTGQTAGTYIVTGLIFGNRRSVAQQLTTGANPGGYELSSVTVGIANYAEGDSVQVSLYTDDGNDRPSSSLYELNAQSIVTSALNAFTAPKNASLEPATKYHVVVQAPTGAIQIDSTTSNDEDDASQPAWSIRDIHLLRDGDSGDWRGTSAESSVHIKVTGRVVVAPPDTTAPALDASTPPAVDGAFLVLTYDEPLDRTSTPSARAFRFRLAGSLRTVSGVAVRGTTVTLTVSPRVTEGQTVTVSYIVPGTNPLQDPSGNRAGALTEQAVTNNTPLGVTRVQVTSTPGTATDTYRLGEEITFTVTFSRAVEVSGSRPHFEFSLGATDKEAAYESGSGTTELVFAYTVGASDSDTNGIRIGDHAIILGTGEYVRGVADMEDAVFTHETIGTQHRHKVDGSLSLPAPATDATLSGLPVQVSAGRGIVYGTRFLENAESHVVRVRTDVSRVAVTPQTRVAAATVAYLDESDAAATDADTMTDVFDLDLTPGRNVVKVKVTATDGATTKTYTLIVVRHAHWPGQDLGVALTANFMAGWGGERAPAMGVNRIGLLFGYFSWTSFEIAGARYRLASVFLVERAFTGSHTTFSADTLAVCFHRYGNPPDALAKKLSLRIDSRDFDFAAASRLAGSNGCYEWARPAGLSWAVGELVTVRLSIANVPATGKPNIVRSEGALLVTQGTIADADGLTLAGAAVEEYTYRYQWLRVDEETEMDIAGAGNDRYELTAADIDKELKVRVSFRDDLGHEETRTSIIRPEISATLTKHDTVERRNGNVDYRFDLELSERLLIFSDDMEEHVFDVTNGVIRWAERIDRDRRLVDGVYRKFSNHWRVTVTPAEFGTPVSVTLPRRACSAQGAVCAPDGRRLGSAQTLALGTPSRLSVSIADATASEADGRIRFPVTLSRGSDFIVKVQLRTTTAGTATPGVDYLAYQGSLVMFPGETGAIVSVPLLPDTIDDPDETVVVEIREVSATHLRGEFPNPRPVLITDATATGTIGNSESVQGAPPGSDGPMAEFRDLPEAHDGSAAFTFELAFLDDFEVTSRTLRDSLLVMNGALTAAQKVDATSSRNWRITVEPDGEEDVTLMLLETTDCEAADAICTADDRPFSSRVPASVRGPEAATRVTSASVTNGPGENGTWDTGETVAAEVRFSDTVTVVGPPGAGPVLTVLLDGVARQAAYTAGTGTDTLRFSHTVSAEDAGARRARVAANGLALNGTILGDNRGRKAEIGFAVAPCVTAVELVADGSGDGVWTAGETVEARLTFSEAVTVAGGAPTVGVSLGGEAGTLGYASGSGSATLVFSRAVTEGEESLTGIAVTADSLALNGATIVSAASALAAELGHGGTEPAAAPETGESSALTAEFLDLPDAHGGAAFTFRLRFSEEIPLSYVTLRDAAFVVTNGKVSAVRRVTPGKDQAWDVTVAPRSSGDVTVTLPARTDCTDTGAICTADHRPLAAPVSETVPETVPAGTPFRVRLEGVPEEHDGTSPVVFEVAFNEEPKAGYSYVTMRDSTLKIRQGGQTTLAPKVRRLNAPHNDRWEVSITPGSKEDLTVEIGPFTACTDTGAVCTAENEVLANEVSKPILGPPGLSVADARGYEAAGATVDFAVTLGRASRERVTVDYATADGPSQGGATADADYTATSGTLTFATGETEKTVSVAVLDDVIDEGHETFTLTLSNAAGGNAWLSDASATGTIENTDPLPRAWLARFGRTAAGHVLEAVQARLSGGGQSQAMLGGQRLERLDEAAQAAAQEGYEQAWAQRLQEGHLQEQPRPVGLRELWAGSSFALTAGAAPGAGSGPGAGSALAGGDGGGRWSVWGRGAWSGFTGTEEEVSVDGEVVTGVVGADYERAALLAGLAVAYSSGSGGYRAAVTGEAGELAAWLIGVHPYVRLKLHERLSVWGLFGYGLLGELELDGDRAAAIGTDLGLVMGALGARGTLLEAAASGGLEVAARADGLLLRVNTEAAAGLAATVAEVTRTRLLLEGSYAVAVLGGMLRPELEAGVRYDGGDAERGAGLVLGGSVSYGLPAWGLSLEASGQGLLRPQTWRLSEWGAAGTLRLDPGAPGRGVALSVAPSWGGAAGGGAERLWQLPDAGALAAGGVPAAAAAGRLDAELSYGLEMPGGSGLLTPYAGVGAAEAGGRTWRTGARVTVVPGLSLGVEGTRSEPSGGAAAEHTFKLNGALRW